MKMGLPGMMVFCALNLLGAIVFATEPATFNEAKALSSKLGKPVLMEFYTEWCVPCKQFAADAKNDTDVVKALEKVVLFTVDAEKGQGKKLGRNFKVGLFPTFIMMDAKEAIIMRFSAYGKSLLLDKLNEAFEDLTPIDLKFSRFEANPNLKDAMAIAGYYDGSDDYKKAVNYYSRAQDLGADTSLHIAQKIFWCTRMGFQYKQFEFAQVLSAADDALEADWSSKLNICDAMIDFCAEQDRKDLLPKYINAGLEVIKDSAFVNSEPENRKFKPFITNKFTLYHSLYVSGDTARAVECKKALMSAGWENDAGQLNNFAWWCFENKTNLEEAESLSKKSVELAKDPKQKAMSLDTQAEICSALGKHGEAVSLIKQAIEQDSENKHYKKQLERFSKLAGS